MQKLGFYLIQLLFLIMCLMHSLSYGVWEELERQTSDGKQLVCLHLPPNDRVDYVPVSLEDLSGPRLDIRENATYLHPTRPSEHRPQRFDYYSPHHSTSGRTPEGEKVFEHLEILRRDGIDGRKQADPSMWHYSTHVYLKLFFPEATEPSVGTGVMIGPHHVLTVGHNIFDHSNGSVVTAIHVFPGFDSTHYYFGQQQAAQVYLFQNWRDQQGDDYRNYDIALILLDRSVGLQTGLCGMVTYQGSIPDQPISLYGYPGTWKNAANDKLVGMKGRKERIDEGNIYYREIDSSRGQSGGPLIQEGEEGAPYVIGIHRAGLSAGANVGTRLTEAMLTSFIFPLLSETWKVEAAILEDAGGGVRMQNLTVVTGQLMIPRVASMGAEIERRQASSFDSVSIASRRERVLLQEEEILYPEHLVHSSPEERLSFFYPRSIYRDGPPSGLKSIHYVSGTESILYLHELTSPEFMDPWYILVHKETKETFALLPLRRQDILKSREYLPEDEDIKSHQMIEGPVYITLNYGLAKEFSISSSFVKLLGAYLPQGIRLEVLELENEEVPDFLHESFKKIFFHDERPNWWKNCCPRWYNCCEGTCGTPCLCVCCGCCVCCVGYCCREDNCWQKLLQPCCQSLEKCHARKRCGCGFWNYLCYPFDRCCGWSFFLKGCCDVEPSYPCYSCCKICCCYAVSTGRRKCSWPSEEEREELEQAYYDKIYPSRSPLLISAVRDYTQNIRTRISIVNQFLTTAFKQRKPIPFDRIVFE